MDTVQRVLTRYLAAATLLPTGEFKKVVAVWKSYLDKNTPYTWRLSSTDKKVRRMGSEFEEYGNAVFYTNERSGYYGLTLFLSVHGHKILGVRDIIAQVTLREGIKDSGQEAKFSPTELPKALAWLTDTYSRLDPASLEPLV